MDYQFITQEHIDKGSINITSAAMDAEVRNYNALARKLSRKKQNVHICFVNWCAIQFILLGYCMFYLICENGDMTLPLFLRLLFAIPYVILFVCLILKKNDRRPLTALLVSLPLPVIAPKLIALTAANAILAHLYTKFENEIQPQLGYPSFVQLRCTYLNDYEK